jgi:hypothetical protein
MDFISNFSPEEILRKKELESGFEYDVPVQDEQELISQTPITPGPGISTLEREVDTLNTPQPRPEPIQQPQNNILETPPVQKEEIQSQPNSLGKSQKMTMEAPPSNLGWKNIPASFLPSGGMFYPESTKIAIRAAEVKEIRHYSTIDDDDKLDIEEKLSYILERCCRIDFPGEGVVSYKDLKQEDRFFIIMAIRDLTFTKGENMIILKPYKKCKSLPDCPFSAGIELRTGVLSSYDIDPEILRYYDASSRCFVFNSKKIGKRIEMFIPSIGVNQELTNFIREAAKRKIEVDDGFISVAPFLFNDWRELSFERILGKMREMDNFWSKEEYSLYFELSERIKIGTNLEVKLECPVCGEKEVTASITFPRGLRSLFVISDIFRELL